MKKLHRRQLPLLQGCVPGRAVFARTDSPAGIFPSRKVNLVLLEVPKVSKAKQVQNLCSAPGHKDIIPQPGAHRSLCVLDGNPGMFHHVAPAGAKATFSAKAELPRLKPLTNQIYLFIWK